MDTFADFADDASNTRQLHIMQIEYQERNDDPVIHCWCRTKDDERQHVEIHGFRPSFYISKDDYKERLHNHDWVEEIDTNPGESTIHGEELVRIYTRLPKHVGGGNDIDKGLREYFNETWEADVFFTNRFLIDTEIHTHLEVDMDETWESQYIRGDYAVEVDDIEAVEDPSWRATPRVITTDIEVYAPDGFPDAEDAEQPVTGITAHDNYDDEYTVWLRRSELWDMTDAEIKQTVYNSVPGDIETDDETFGATIADVHVYDDEAAMLYNYNEYVKEKRPDLLSGWNSSSTMKGDAFDYPYLLERSQNLNLTNYRDWSPLGQVWTTRRGREQNLTMGGKGVGFFDMMEGYKKTQTKEPDGGWGLENTSDRELGDAGKLELEDIDDAWNNDLSTFIEYNIRDVQAVLAIDHSAGAMSMYQDIRRIGGVQFEDCNNAIDTLDVFIIRLARQYGYALPTNEAPDRDWYYGAHNFTPKLGRHENVVYPDLWSMYPNMVRNCNMSPETLIGTREDLAASEYDEDDCRWTYIDTRQTSHKRDSDPVYTKLYFVKPSIETGFMNEVIGDLMDMKDSYKGLDLYGPLKHNFVNAVYGVFGDSNSYGRGYRLFDWRIAEGITLGGRKMIQDSSERFVDAVNTIKEEDGYEGQNAYRVAGDTDSVMTSIPFVDVFSDKSEKAQSDSTDSDDVDFTDDELVTLSEAMHSDGTVSDRSETMFTQDDGTEIKVPRYYSAYKEVLDIALSAADVVNEWYDEWTSETFNLTDGEHYCELEIESVSKRVFIPEGITKKYAKKRYCQLNVWDEDDGWIYPMEFDVTGIDVVRSDRAPLTRSVLNDVLDTILRVDDVSEARKQVYDTIKSEAERVENGDYVNEEIGRPKGMNRAPETYGSPESKAQATYRGARYANRYFDWEHITSGDKPCLFYLDSVRGGDGYPGTYPTDWETAGGGRPVDAVSVNEPNELPDTFVIDVDKQLEKVLEDPVTPLLSAMNWSYDDALADTDQSNIASFM